ncbi:hypothetical protein H7F15_17925 [Pontibacter sp. Tf4]|uniref:hypothetical protein n=1 Tax=Pontibacter sp. Tf4 TaxID=2761620 RepID=UPI00162847F6|nr:hypothetical protein [Pontibacter sp. Tf4]MBB6612924.1 hypothetical protein [Pontibacter sp. Tf4]
MLRPQKEKPNTTSFAKFVRIFTLLMTLLYMLAGLFIIFADEQMMNIGMAQNTRYMLGGILILYSLVRFVRAYKANTDKDRNRYEE